MSDEGREEISTHWTEVTSDHWKFRKWADIGEYHIYPWSTAGTESCVVVSTDHGLRVAFDLGYACDASLSCDHIFISHGHMDHVSAIPQHASKRSLCLGTKGPSTYYVPAHLIEPLQAICQNYEKMAEQKLPVVFKAVTAGERINISHGYHVVPFPTIHRVPSFGYILCKTRKELKDEFKGQDSNVIAKLKSEGVAITDDTVTYEIAYTGDTTFDVFLSPHTCMEDLLRVKLLITECTYLKRTEKGLCLVKRAKEKGHCHIANFTENIELLRNVGSILLTHISSKYQLKDVCNLVGEELLKIPQEYDQKIYIATVTNFCGRDFVNTPRVFKFAGHLSPTFCKNT